MARPRRALALWCALALLLPGARAFAEWTSLGPMPAPRRDGPALLFQNGQGTVAVSAVAPSVVRVRFRPGPALGRDHSYAVLDRPSGDPAARAEVGDGRSVLSTAGLRVTLRHAPFRLSFATAEGLSLDEDDPSRGMAFAGRQSGWTRTSAGHVVVRLRDRYEPFSVSVSP